MEIPTIETKWEYFARIANMPPGSPGGRVGKKIFYAGASAMIECLRFALKNVDEVEGAKYLNELQYQLDAEVRKGTDG